MCMSVRLPFNLDGQPVESIATWVLEKARDIFDQFGHILGKKFFNIIHFNVRVRIVCHVH
jgi:hypothetical protein